MQGYTRNFRKLDFRISFRILGFRISLTIRFQDGYAKLSEYVNDKLWPEVCLFRERFGYLPEFPPKDGATAEVTKPENTIKYWQDKLQAVEIEHLALRKDNRCKVDEIAALKRGLEDQRTALSLAEAECECSRVESAGLASRTKELQDEISALKNQLNHHETLVGESEFRRQYLHSGNPKILIFETSSCM